MKNMRRIVAMGLAVLLSVPGMALTKGLPAANAQAETMQQLATFRNFEKTYTTVNTDAAKTTIYANWTSLDGGSPLDLSQKDLSQCYLQMNIHLEKSGTSESDSTLFRSGMIKLRSVDDPNEQNAYYWVGNLNLQTGDNAVSIKLSDMTGGSNGSVTAINWSKVNRVLTYIDSVNTKVGTFSMTLSGVKIVEVLPTGMPEAELTQPSQGLSSMDKIVYNYNAFAMGADRSGRDDSTAVIQSCLNQAASKGGVVFLPAGRYKVTGTLNIPSGVTLRGEWKNPDEGGLGKGTILMAYAGRGSSLDTDTPFVFVSSGSSFRDISVWYPEQSATNPVAYPPTIKGDGHTVVQNVTLYNSYRGFYNAHCSSMLIRGLYGTVLQEGIYAEKGYDIPRTEQVRLDTKYWINSGLPNAPSGSNAQTLVNYVKANAVGIAGGQQDWGYWYDIKLNNLKYGVRLFHGNISIGKLVTTNVQIGIYIEKVSYPGLELSYSDISASDTGIYYNVSGRETLSISATTFRGSNTAIRTVGVAQHGISLHGCTFASWNDCTIQMDGGSLNASRCLFQANKVALDLGASVDQAVLVGNTFQKADDILTGTGWSQTDSRLVRDDGNRDIPTPPAYEYDNPPLRQPSGNGLFNVKSYGAKADATTDDTAAIQSALNAAGQAGGGTVYAPAGIYRLNGSLSVPTGVELRGSFDGAHYGNSTTKGTQFYVYGNKDNASAAPLITLAQNAGAKGFTVFYPEQGYSDKALIDAEKVHAYPPTIRANAGDWIQNIAIVAGYTGIDAMTNRCDGLVVLDVTGCVMKEAMRIGHGIDGGWVQNFHFNYTGWGHQGFYASNPGNQLTADGETPRVNLLGEYATREVTGITLGDCRNVRFFSDFNITINTQLHLIADPYTGGSFNGTMYGVAFDACQHGVVAESGIDAELTLLSSMGVFHRNGAGYNVWTKPGFTGTVSIYNTDAWGTGSKLALVEGGTVNLVHYFSWCAYRGVCRAGGTLNMLGSTIIAASNNDNGAIPTLIYENGAQGKVIGNLDCRKRLNIQIAFGAQVTEALNGVKLALSEPQTLARFSNIEQTYTIQNTADKKYALGTNWKVLDGGAPVDLTGYDLSKVYLQVKVTLDKGTSTVADSQLYRNGMMKLRSSEDNPERNNNWNVGGLQLHQGDNYVTLRLSESNSGANASGTVAAIDWSKVNRMMMYIDSLNNYEGTFSMTLSDAQLVYRAYA